jgi:hypothetical protein
VPARQLDFDRSGLDQVREKTLQKFAHCARLQKRIGPKAKVSRHGLHAWPYNAKSRPANMLVPINKKFMEQILANLCFVFGCLWMDKRR